MKPNYLFTIIFITFLTVSSNSYGSKKASKLPKTTQAVLNEAARAGFAQHLIEAPPFLLMALVKCPTQNTSRHLYIEGDGNSWKTKFILSDDPTPKQPLALKLALRDPHPCVIYLARPGQYIFKDTHRNFEDTHCHSRYWSTHRYAPEVIDAYQLVLDRIQNTYGKQKLLLVGFSGGASIATLIATQRDDLEGVITVAGDLNHSALNRHHHTSALYASLNPFFFTEKLTTVPQCHWSGEQDVIVPAWVAQDFVAKLNSSGCAKHYVLKNANHHRGWEKHWTQILRTPLPCKNENNGTT